VAETEWAIPPPVKTWFCDDWRGTNCSEKIWVFSSSRQEGNGERWEVRMRDD
jgi:hypothetical protein